jgi:hypothetical protein
VALRNVAVDSVEEASLIGGGDLAQGPGRIGVEVFHPAHRREFEKRLVADIGVHGERGLVVRAFDHRPEKATVGRIELAVADAGLPQVGDEEHRLDDAGRVVDAIHMLAA